MKQIKFSILLAILLTIGLAGFLSRSVQATPGSGAIWTTNIDCGVSTFF